MNSSTRRTRRRRWAIGGVAAIALIGLGAGVAYGRYFGGADYRAVAWEAGPDIAQSLQASLSADVAANPWVQGASIYVRAPDLGIDLSLAAGSADPKSDEPMTPGHAVRIASVTKSYVAATAIALHEQGVLSLEASLVESVSPEHAALLNADGYDVAAIKVADLLDHRSGIPDYVELDAYARQIIISDLFGQNRIWTRRSQLVFALDRTDPLWGPDGGFAYSDTGYILLGEAIEQATGQSLPEAVRATLDFERLGLSATWWEALETAPSGVPRAHQFAGKADVNGIDASIDLFGGGGLMATPREMGLAMRAIVVGEVFADPGSVGVMQTLTDGNYANGIVRYSFDAGPVCWGHTGFWGLVAFHCPDEDITIAMSYSQSNVTGLGARANAILTALLAEAEKG